MKQDSVGKIIIGIFTAIFTISLIIFIAIGIGEIKDANYEPRYLEEEDYVDTLQRDNYTDLLDMTCRDTLLGKSYSETILACQAVAHYYEAASLYKAYLTTDSTKSAATQLHRMEQYASQTGEFEMYIDRINKLLEIDSMT